MKYRCLVLLLIKSVQYRLSRQSVSFWDWLYGGLENYRKGRVNRRCFVKYLFVDAYHSSDSKKMCDIYENYREEISSKKLQAKDLLFVYYSALRERRKAVADSVVDIIESDPKYFPSNFLNSYRSEYFDTFNNME